MPAPGSSPHVAVHRFVLLLIVLGAVLVLAPNLLRASYRFSITYNEGWSLYHGARVSAGEALYDPAKPLIPVNYPPLYFYMEAAAGRVSGDMLLAGRWISIASLFLLSVLAGCVVRMLGGGWPDAALSAALLAGYIGSYLPQYVGMNDPQLLAHVLVFGGFLVLLKDRTNPKRLLAASCLIACGLFFKHNLLAAPVAAASGLFLESRKRFVMFVGFMACALSILTIGTLLFAGSDFVHQILSPRTMSVAKLLENTRHFVTFMALPILAAIGWIIKKFPAGSFQYMALYLLFSLAAGIVASSGFGTAGNMFLDAILALAVISGALVANLRSAAPAGLIAPWLPAILAAALAGNFLLDAPAALKGLLNGATASRLEQRQNIFLKDVDYLSQRPGPALCETLSLCFFAGKPMELDPFNISQTIVTGAAQEKPVLDLIASGHFRTIQFKGQRVLEASRIQPSSAPEIYPDTFFTRNMMAAVQERCDLNRKTQTGMFYEFR